ncbi:MAG: KTSC domain-containing protein [Candidatus Fonsibacter sp.]
MPVKKEQGETKDEYIGRCIGIEINNGYEQDQAVAMCIAKADEEFTILDEFKKWRSKPTSANVKDIMYNDEIEELVIKFHDGQIYTYSNISFSTFQTIYTGDAAPITSGENRWHKWEEGKAPSVGAAVYKVLVRRKAPFTKGGSLR